MTLFEDDGSESTLSRRIFVGRTARWGAALAATMAGALKLADEAKAYTVYCCNLLYSYCPGTSCSGCQTAWSWQCVYQGVFYTCGECYDNGCAPCSYYIRHGGGAPPP